ncbi:carbonate dehydratase [Nitzschia inconspicua]|uniref:Carbonate dehydratase n=1 Tax=Nitzschia inconspicua TaxID=303405 RepID=A0A9K3M4F3_9STRA|nr:carbonate dehydratase [Nitzschia inconspicua]
MRVALIQLHRRAINVSATTRCFSLSATNSRVLASVLSKHGITTSNSSTIDNERFLLLSRRTRSTLTKSSIITLDGTHHQRQTFTKPGQIAFKSSVAASKTEDDESSKQKAVEKPKVAILEGEDNSRFPWDLGITSLVPEWKRMFNKDTLFTDISAGVTVGCIAVPLSLAIALASGVPAEVGLVTAAVSGVAGGLMGGTTLAVTGPAAAISLLVVSAVQQHGLEALPIITLGCGALQMASGMTQMGVVAKLVPASVIAGFTTGVGTLILTGQLPKALGMTAPAGMNPVELLGFIGENVASINPSAAALAIGTSAAMFMLPKIHPKMPSALVAVGGATLATHAMGLDVALIGDIPSGLAAFQFGLPALPPMDALPSLSATIFLIYAMTSVESLLSCAALEKMKKTPYKYNPDQELVGQGLANVGSALFMGMPVTSVIARSSLNVRLKAETRLPALVQAGFVFSSVVFFSDKISMVPMPALSGVLITTGLGMLNPQEFQHSYAVQKIETVVPFVTTIGGMISFGLAEGIGMGCASALAMNMYGAWTSPQETMFRMQAYEYVPSPAASPISIMSTSTAQVREVRTFHTMTTLPDTLDPPTDRSSVWKVTGPINFVSMFEIDNMMRRIKEHNKCEESPLDNILIDMTGVTGLEFTGVEEFVTRLTEVADGTPIKMINCRKDVQDAFDHCKPSQEIIYYRSESS